MKIKKVLITKAFLLITIISNATTYYVKTSGNDSNTGLSDAQAWATWQKAFKTAVAGDTVFFRGGVYKPTFASHGNNVTMIKPPTIGHNGEQGNPICFYNYPGEVPILDCSSIVPPGHYCTGLEIEDAAFLNFRGLTICNVKQFVLDDQAFGIMAYGVHSLRFENITVYNIGGAGINYYTDETIPDSSYFINCDVHDCCDSLLSEYPGGRADGYFIQMKNGGYGIIEGCRAWHCSDDGINLDGGGYMEIRNSWSFNNGILEGDGNGFKLGGVGDINTYMPINRKITNCIAAFNHNPYYPAAGFDHNNGDGYWPRSRIYNCASYNNDIGFMAITWANLGGVKDDVYHNNFSYKDGDILDMGSYEPTSDTYNSWRHISTGVPYYEVVIPLTEADFASLDSSQLYKSRKVEDNSLPDIDFLKLAKGSKLIDAGIDVGLPFLGNAPDLGAFERE